MKMSSASAALVVQSTPLIGHVGYKEQLRLQTTPIEPNTIACITKTAVMPYTAYRGQNCQFLCPMSPGKRGRLCRLQ